MTRKTPATRRPGRWPRPSEIKNQDHYQDNSKANLLEILKMFVRIACSSEYNISMLGQSLLERLGASRLRAATGHGQAATAVAP
jgi:hypothetical protein